MITLKDIAKKAGVHTGAVSYVLNDKPKAQSFRPETRERIIKIANELGYRRNAIAQAMQTGKTNVIAVVGVLAGSYAMDIITGISNIATKNGFLLKILPFDTNIDINRIANICIEQRIDGVICRIGQAENVKLLHEKLTAYSIPLVSVDNNYPIDICSQVYSYDYQGAKEATKYLWDAGHRNIVNIIADEPKRRAAGYDDMMRQLGGKAQRVKVENIIEMSEDFQRVIKKTLTELKPTAFFCSTDPIAMQVLSVALSLGIKVPQDLSVIGFGGLDYTAFSAPPLTTVKQPFAEIGRKACEILLSEIKEKTLPRGVKIPVKLVIRDSCKKLIIK